MVYALTFMNSANSFKEQSLKKAWLNTMLEFSHCNPMDFWFKSGTFNMNALFKKYKKWLVFGN